MKQMEQPPDNASSLRDGRILIVDDDRDVLLAAEIVLKKHFGRIVTATEPKRLPDLLSGEAFDVPADPAHGLCSRSSRAMSATRSVAPGVPSASHIRA